MSGVRAVLEMMMEFGRFFVEGGLDRTTVDGYGYGYSFSTSTFACAKVAVTLWVSSCYYAVDLAVSLSTKTEYRIIFRSLLRPLRSLYGRM